MMPQPLMKSCISFPRARTAARIMGSGSAMSMSLHSMKTESVSP